MCICFSVSPSQIGSLLLDAPTGWYVHVIAGQRLISGAAVFSICFWCLLPQSGRCQNWTTSDSRTCCFACLVSLFRCLALSNLLFAFGWTHNLVHVIAGELLIFEIAASSALFICFGASRSQIDYLLLDAPMVWYVGVVPGQHLDFEHPVLSYALPPGTCQNWTTSVHFLCFLPFLPCTS